MATYQLISSVTVGAGGAASVTFGSGVTIPQTYTDLIVKISGRDSVTGTNNIYVSVNGLSAGKWMWMRGDGGSAISGSNASSAGFLGYTPTASDTSNTFGNLEIYIPNYTSSNYKSISGDGVSENNGSQAFATLTANLFTQTAAITSLTFTVNTAFVQFSTFYLYGIKNS